MFSTIFLEKYFFYLETIVVEILQTETMTDPGINTTIRARMTTVKNGCF
jgi:hypothetical protein